VLLNINTPKLPTMFQSIHSFWPFL